MVIEKTSRTGPVFTLQLGGSSLWSSFMQFQGQRDRKVRTESQLCLLTILLAGSPNGQRATVIQQHNHLTDCQPLLSFHPQAHSVHPIHSLVRVTALEGPIVQQKEIQAGFGQMVPVQIMKLKFLPLLQTKVLEPYSRFDVSPIVLLQSSITSSSSASKIFLCLNIQNQTANSTHLWVSETWYVTEYFWGPGEKSSFFGLPNQETHSRPY